jgi:hypothetical protein
VPGFPGTKPGTGSIRDSIEMGRSSGVEYVEGTDVATATYGDDHFTAVEAAFVSVEELRESLHGAVLELAQGLLDQGKSNHQLSIYLAEYYGFEDDVAANESAMMSLRLRENNAEQTTREREAPLRFAIGEFQFDREQEADPACQADLDRQIQALTARLRGLLERTEQELEEMTSQGIDLAAARASLEEERETAFFKLRTAIDSLMPQVVDDLSLAPLVDRYESIGLMLERC